MAGGGGRKGGNCEERVEKVVEGWKREEMVKREGEKSLRGERSGVQRGRSGGERGRRGRERGEKWWREGEKWWREGEKWWRERRRAL